MGALEYIRGVAKEYYPKLARWLVAEIKPIGNKAVLVQTIILIVTLLGIAIAADRRVTVVEQSLKQEREIRTMVDKEYGTIIYKLQENQNRSIENQTKLTVLVDQIVKRHELEDRVRIKDNR